MENFDKIPALLVGKDLPNFQQISPEQVKSSIPILLKQLDTSFDSLEENIEQNLKDNNKLEWNSIMNPLQGISERLRWSWGVISHLNGVCNSKELREAYSSQQPNVIRFTNRIGQSKLLYKALTHLNSSTNKTLDVAQKRILDAELLSMKHKGVGLNESDKEIFNSNTERLAELSNNYSNNVIDATQNWTLLISEPGEIKGLPVMTLEALSSAANNSNSEINSTPEKGPWLLSLDIPTYISVVTYSENRKLREMIYKAYVSRASSGNLNNQKIIEEILNIRLEQSNLLGYRNWAELSLSSKMAKNVDEVEKLLEDLRIASFSAAKKEISELYSYSIEKSNNNDFAPWDIPFWSEKLKKKKLNIDQEKLREWFPLPQVLKGLFDLSERLFGITIEKETSTYPKWHKDVELFNLLDSYGKKIASFYLDPYTRPGSKRGGAWMDECLNRDSTNKSNVILPVAYLVCNQTPPIGEKPSLMSFEEVRTLFHEFGHGLQHMLTKVDYPQAAGINNIEWDAVELPSQFMENWCLDKKTLTDIAKHWQTGDPLPEEEFRKLKESNTFNSGINTLRQIHFAITDLKLHSQWNCKLGITPDELRRDIAKNTTVIEPISEDKFLCSFSHIFAGGYSAGYYSYKWAEVLSADAFAAFEEVGLDNRNEIKNKGRLFKETILGLGGSRNPEDVFIQFRGRKANTNALIRHLGLNH